MPFVECLPPLDSELAIHESWPPNTPAIYLDQARQQTAYWREYLKAAEQDVNMWHFELAQPMAADFEGLTGFFDLALSRNFDRLPSGDIGEIPTRAFRRLLGLTALTLLYRSTPEMTEVVESGLCQHEASVLFDTHTSTSDALQDIRLHLPTVALEAFMGIPRPDDFADTWYRSDRSDLYLNCAAPVHPSREMAEALRHEEIHVEFDELVTVLPYLPTQKIS